MLARELTSFNGFEVSPLLNIWEMLIRIHFIKQFISNKILLFSLIINF